MRTSSIGLFSCRASGLALLPLSDDVRSLFLLSVESRRSGDSSPSACRRTSGRGRVLFALRSTPPPRAIKDDNSLLSLLYCRSGEGLFGFVDKRDERRRRTKEDGHPTFVASYDRAGCQGTRELSSWCTTSLWVARDWSAPELLTSSASEDIPRSPRAC